MLRLRHAPFWGTQGFRTATMGSCTVYPMLNRAKPSPPFVHTDCVALKETRDFTCARHGKKSKSCLTVLHMLAKTCDFQNMHKEDPSEVTSIDDDDKKQPNQFMTTVRHALSDLHVADIDLPSSGAESGSASNETHVDECSRWGWRDAHQPFRGGDARCFPKSFYTPSSQEKFQLLPKHCEGKNGITCRRIVSDCMPGDEEASVSDDANLAMTDKFVSIGPDYACGVYEGSRVACWGNKQGVLNAPGSSTSKAFLSRTSVAAVSAAENHVCVLEIGLGGAHCTGDDSFNQISHAPWTLPLNISDTIVVPKPRGEGHAGKFMAPKGSQIRNLSVHELTDLLQIH